jgi:hypothetical protein
MRKFAASALVAAMIGAASPALAQSASGSEFSMQRAVFIAREIGVVGINQVNFYDGKWQVSGRDPGGQNIKVEVDAETGAVMNVDRWW